MAEEGTDEAEDHVDPGVAVVRHVADGNTVRSVKATLLTALLVRAVRRPSRPTRRTKLLTVGAGAAVVLKPDALTQVVRLFT